MLNEGDYVTFGHMFGQTIKPGTRVRQPESEYQFVVSLLITVVFGRWLKENTVVDKDLQLLLQFLLL